MSERYKLVAILWKGRKSRKVAKRGAKAEPAKKLPQKRGSSGMQPFFSSQLAAAFSCILHGDQIEKSFFKITLTCMTLIFKQIFDVLSNP